MKNSNRIIKDLLENIDTMTLEEGKILDFYLNSIGRNPTMMGTNEKIGHSKTKKFKDYLKVHNVQEENIRENDSDLFKRFLRSKGINPDIAKNKQATNMRISIAKSGDFQIWKQNQMSGGYVPMESVNIEESTDKRDCICMNIPLLLKILEFAREKTRNDVQIHQMVERLLQIRSRGNLTMDDYTAITRLKEDYNIDDDIILETVQNNTLKIIKQLHFEIMREEMYDHEKDDKDRPVQTYGVKPKHQKLEKTNFGEKNPRSSAILTGGKTLTKSTRDDIEIDPLMTGRPGQPDPTKKKQNR